MMKRTVNESIQEIADDYSLNKKRKAINRRSSNTNSFILLQGNSSAYLNIQSNTQDDNDSILCKSENKEITFRNKH